MSVCAEEAPAADTFTLVAVGDIMMGTTWPEEILPPQDGTGIFDNVVAALGESDIVFGNLEGPLLDNGTGVKCEGGKSVKKSAKKITKKNAKKNAKKGVKSLCFEFRMPTRYAGRLAEAGFTVVNIANNHAWDFGREGVESTIATLREAGIQPVGGETVALLDVDGKRAAVVAFSYSPPSPYAYPLQDIPSAATVVSRLKAEYDLVIVSFHGGAEGKEALKVPDAEEIFAGEDRGNVVRFARAVVDAGADAVIGHGPHVPRALEVYKGKLIAYSLGNFLTYGRFNLREESGISLILKVRMDLETGDFAGGAIVPVVLRDWGIPSLDPEKKSVRLIRGLTALRPGPAGLSIEEDGSLIPEAAKAPSPLREEEAGGHR